MLPAKLEKTVDSFVKDIAALYGEDVVSIFLYGSAVTGEFSAGSSSVDIAIVMKGDAADTLERGRRIIQKRSYSRLNPVFFTEIYINSSLDVFPLEFLNMKEHNKILSGRDLLSGIVIDLKDLKAQCERELKVKLLHSRNILLKARFDNDLKKAMVTSVSSILHLLRYLLKANGVESDPSSAGILEAVEKNFGLRMEAIRKILPVKKGNERLSPSETRPLFRKYIDLLEEAAGIADKD